MSKKLSRAVGPTPGEWTAWHTPGGEWAIRAVWYEVFREAPARHTAFIATLHTYALDDEANARLMASAKNLLALARELTELLPDGMASKEHALAIIAKATGEQP